MNRKITIFVASLLFLIVGCQEFNEQSDEWKSTKIQTMYRKYAQEFPQVKSISVAELQQLQQQQKSYTLIDVRPLEERAVSQIPGAISLKEFEQNLKQYQDTTIIAYCTIGYRSGKYAQKLRRQGIEILNLEGSLLAWSHIQGKLVNHQGMTKKLHIFNRQWQLTRGDYQPIW